MTRIGGSNNCTSRIPLNDFSRATYKELLLSRRGSNGTINSIQIMNTGRFRAVGICNIICLDNTITPWFKNSVNNNNLNSIPFGERVGNVFRSALIKGGKREISERCIDRQFGRPCGTGGPRLVNTF